MKLSIVIPVYNEKDYIREIVDSVIKAPVADLEKEIIIVDDNSTDGTIDILRSEIEPIVQKIIYKGKNQGKGAALRTGFQHASGDIFVVQDSEYDPNEYIKLLKPILRDKADVVYGLGFTTVLEQYNLLTSYK